MKILLLGEYSGFNTNLKKGFEELGIECDLASNGDGWKKIEGSNMLLYKYVEQGKLKKMFYHNICPLIEANKFYGYDIVQMVRTGVFSPRINIKMFDKIKKHSGKMFVSVAGGCHSLYESYKNGDLEYYVYDDNPQSTALFDGVSKYSQLHNAQEEYVYSNVNGIIPIMYEYAIGVHNRSNCMNTIQLPFDATGIDYVPNVVKDKIVIAHGILNEAKKGTQYIREAMEIIKEKYPNDVEIAIDGRMPLAEYQKWLRRANILVDQCKEHCYGLNALYAMAEGRIVLGGASENSLKEFGLTSCPVYHIEPNVDQIVAQLENVISQRKNFEQIGYESRKFVETFHNHITVAQKYLDTWKI